MCLSVPYACVFVCVCVCVCTHDHKRVAKVLSALRLNEKWESDPAARRGGGEDPESPIKEV